MAKYFLMKHKRILRLEENEDIQHLSKTIQSQLLDSNWQPMNQEQANYRVAIFRDEILELTEYEALISSTADLRA
jgi:hypothetical protein